MSRREPIPAERARVREVREEGVRLMWPGRKWRLEETTPAPTAQGGGETLCPIEIVGVSSEMVGASSEMVGAAGVAGERAGPAVRLVHADALELSRALATEGLAGQVDLVYVDPPFASERDYVAEARLDGPADGRVRRTRAYEDRWSARDGGIGAYLEMLAPRLEGLARLLSPGGTLWVHLDWRAAYLVRAVLDEIFGREGFLNEIVWRRAPNLGRQAVSGQFGRTLDTLVVYGGPKATLTPPTRLEPIEPSAIRWGDDGRPFTSAPRGDYTDASIAKLEAQGRVHRTASGRIYIKYFLVKDGSGSWCRERRVDTLWTDVPPLRHASPSERTGYPTQKPRALLERVVSCATSPGGLVVDAFAGSGTTGVAAHGLGRRVVLGDRSSVALAAARARLLREGASLRIDRGATADVPERAVVRVAVERVARAEAGTVRLLEPEEPLAWAIGREERGVFHCGWHSERTPGTRPVPAERSAPAALGAPVSVRVWGDDGSVGVEEVRA